jgi:hypothetical protein
VGRASSAKKVARLAQRGKGKKVRFQGGNVFPVALVVTLVLGLALVAYSRQAGRAEAVEPKVGTHWHIAFGVYTCDTWRADLTGDKESPLDDEYVATGVHSHDDGVIHYHARTGAATGRKAKLNVFLDVYDVVLTDSKLTFPEDQGGDVYEEGVTKCDGKDATLKVVVWDQYDNADDFKVDVVNLGEERITNDAMAIAIAFVPEGVDVPLPPSATDLPERAAVDSGESDTLPTTVPGTDTTAPAGSVTTAAPDTTAADGTSTPEAPTTTGG